MGELKFFSFQVDMNEIKILYADHGTDLKSYLSNLNSGDINLMAGSHLFQFHRQYLAAVSPLVRHLLQSQPFSDTITLDGVRLVGYS